MNNCFTNSGSIRSVDQYFYVNPSICRSLIAFVLFVFLALPSGPAVGDQPNLILMSRSLANNAVMNMAFRPLGIAPGYTSSYAIAVSADGSVVVGNSENATASEAFRWTATGGMQGLGDLPGAGFASAATAVSADGLIVVGRGWGASGTEIFRWTSASGIQGLGDLPGGSFFSTATAISANGQIIGGHGNNAQNEQEACRWVPTDMIKPLGHLPDRTHFGSVLAASVDGSFLAGYSGSEAFRWSEAGGMVGLSDLAGGSFQSEARGISADGSVVVGSGTTAAGTEAFRWTEAEGLVSLEDLSGGAVVSRAFGVSADGSIVVGYGTSSVGQEAFIWDATHGMRSLRDLLVTNGVAMDGWVLTSANGISADGSTIVGHGINALGQVEAWVVLVPNEASAVPEPSTFALAGLCLVGLGFVALRRKHRRA